MSLFHPIVAPADKLRTLTDEELRIIWGECSLCISCSCGVEDLILTTDTFEDVRCDCGRIYRLTQTVQVAEPEVTP